jgi:hypothetical protein
MIAEQDYGFISQPFLIGNLAREYDEKPIGKPFPPLGDCSLGVMPPFPVGQLDLCGGERRDPNASDQRRPVFVF